MSRFVLLIALAAACGGGSASSDGQLVFIQDSAPPGPDAPPVFDVNLRTRGTLTFVVYRDGSGAWQPIDFTGSNTTIIVHADYQLVYACAGSAVGGGSGSAGALLAQEIDAIPDDGRQILSCGGRGGIPGSGSGGGSGSAALFALSGTMAEAGTVYLGSAARSGSSAPWAWSFEVANGTYTVAATDAAGSNVLLREGLAVAGSNLAVTPALDTTLEGSAFVTTTLAATGVAAGAAIASSTVLRTESGSTVISAGSGFASAYVPEGLFSSHDSQSVVLTASTAGSVQSGTAALVGVEAPPTYALLAALPVTFATTTGVLVAQWSAAAVPSGGYQLVARSADGTQQQSVTATAGWLALHPTPALAFDITATGYDAAWVLDFTQAFTGSFIELGADASATYSTTVLDLASASAR